MTKDSKRESAMPHEQKSERSTSANSREDAVILPPEAQGQIGKQLRKVYGEVLAEPMPDKFAELLARLSQSESNQ